MKKGRHLTAALFVVVIAMAASSAFAAQGMLQGLELDSGTVIASKKGFDTAAGVKEGINVRQKAEWVFAATLEGADPGSTVSAISVSVTNAKASAITSPAAPAEGQKEEPVESPVMVAKEGIPEPVFTLDRDMRISKNGTEGYGPGLGHIDPGRKTMVLG